MAPPWQILLISDRNQPVISPAVSLAHYRVQRHQLGQQLALAVLAVAGASLWMLLVRAAACERSRAGCW
jgi:hypothetical protein